MTGLIPSNKWEEVEHLTVRTPGETTQVGCVYCLSENVDAPVPASVVYYVGGTSMCSRHVREVHKSNQKGTDG